ncbi:MAG: heavy metal translocating P-type ATPase [Gemmatimonadetes bacterium]|nr:heavy metal translocating P-type ATPase [Gemmatimonadota bacterium]
MSATLAEPVTRSGLSCVHCGLPVPSPATALPEADGPFCCAGCRTAWQVIHAAGLGEYYASGDRRLAAVTPSGRRYDEYDHPSFESLYGTTLPDGTREIALYLDRVHCASCVWLVERVPLAVPGALAAELDVPRSLATIRWNPGVTSLGTIARFLDQLGYPSHPFQGGRGEANRRAEDRTMLLHIGVAGAIALNVMTLALALYAGWFGSMEAEYTRYFRWLSMALTVPAVVWPGRVFFTSAWGALRARRLHMDVPIALALGAGTLRGVVNTVAETGPIYFDGVVTLIFLLLVGRFLQQRAQRSAADAAELLHGLTPHTARLVTGAGVEEVPSRSLVPGVTVEVRPGDTVPADGIAREGRSALDLSVLTGESAPVSVGAGEPVFAGTVNLGATIRVEVTQAGEASRLGRILRELEAGMRRRAPVVHTADRLAGWFVAAVLVLAAVTYLVWSRRDPTVALDNAIALLVVTCPCALALATPLTFTAAIGRAARQLVLIRGADALEVLSRPGQLVLDKTGTLTEGRLALETWIGGAGLEPVVLGLERHSRHPIAAAFARAWPTRTAAVIEDPASTLGAGVTGRGGDHRYAIGSVAFVLARAIDPNRLADRIPGHQTGVLLARDGVVVAAAGFGDPLRTDSMAAVARLGERGWTIGILSGDAPGAVAAVGARLGIPPERVRGGVTPEGKLAAVRELAARGPVVMVGDGVNDAPAIGAATVGVGVRGGAEACLAAADVFLAKTGLGPLVTLFEGAERTMAVVRRNIAVSIGYNLVGAALAVTGTIDPLIAAVMMPVSSLTVILLSVRSKTFEAPR